MSHRHRDKYAPVQDFMPNIGKRVRKCSGKPFKCGEKINTVTGIIVNKELGNVACYTFVEDESYVECHRCVVVEGQMSGVETVKNFIKGSERHLHHIWCNFFMLPREGCKQCESLFARFPKDGSPDEMVKKHFPNVIEKD